MVGISAMALMGCRNTQEAVSPTVNYTQYQTYRFGSRAMVGSENPLFKWAQLSSRIEKALEFHLPSAGLDYASIGSEPDLIIFYYVVTETGTEPPMVNYLVGWKAAPFLARGEQFSEYEENRLVLDFVDAANDELVWRRSTDLSLKSEKEAYRELSKKIRELVQKYPHPPPKS
ncbi:DUF4136 domain-containing protein [Halalkalibaculum sp. DA384]|uniref:DUF4136 domain-containing protein n=1 Tax=Halalkalibaculum sp. DA384 TaxID=3373606 RepID=UPI003754DEBF